MGGARGSGGSTGSPTAPTRSTPSRSCRSPPPSWPARRRVLDVGCGEGQITRLAAGLDGVELAVGVDPTWNQITRRRRARAAPTGFARAGADRLPFADGVVRRRRRLPRVRAHRRRRRGDRRGRPGPRAGRPVLLLPQPPAAADAGRAAGSTTRSLDPPEQYWRIGPYLPEAVTIEEVEPGVHIRFVHRPLSPLRERARRPRAAASSGWSSRRRRPGSSPWRRSTREAATVPRLLYLRTRQDRR